MTLAVKATPDTMVDKNSDILNKCALCLCWAALSVFAVIAWPVDVLEIHLEPVSRQQLSKAGFGEEGSLLFASVAPLGSGYETRIIHSVQLTPVVDRYRVQQGQIWGWQELVLSHNAGLPFDRPERGRFNLEDRWMLVEGGGAFWPEIFYRVGTGRFGKTLLYHPFAGIAELWREAPGARLRFTVKNEPLLSRLLKVECRLGFAFSPHGLSSVT